VVFTSFAQEIALVKPLAAAVIGACRILFAQPHSVLQQQHQYDH
jgi:hypothetical protein